MTQIERRQARIRRIRERLTKDGASFIEQDNATSPNSRYHIGKTQNQPEHIVTFVQKNSGDPAVKVTFLSTVLIVGLTC